MMRIPGSFRDPSGYVFEAEGEIFRAINDELATLLRELTENGTLPRLMESGKLVKSRFVEPSDARHAALAGANPGFRHFLHHARLERLSFPYEWSVSMLADAALLTLDLQIALARKGYALKDASAYNVQFVNGRPVFIDLGSIERPKRQDIWYALGQFQRHFLFPLLLTCRRGWDLCSYFTANLDGLPLSQVAAAFTGWSKWSVFLDVTLPYYLERKNKAGASLNAAPRGTGSGSVEGQILNLERLRRKITKLVQRYRIDTVWHDYTATCTYTESSTAEKKRLIHEFLQGTQPRSVLDLGCNTGDYSYLAAGCGAEVVAADADSGAIELLYRRLQKEPARIQPMVVNLANPSPAIGYLNRERPAFLERGRSECVFALALIHHLLVSANLTLEAVRDLFATLTTRYLVLEFVPVGDPQFQRLLQFRECNTSRFTLEQCIEAFAPAFRLLRQERVAGLERTLLFFERCP